MTADDDKPQQVAHLVRTPHLADALQNEQFRRFLDQIPLAIVVAELRGDERIVFANPEFETLAGQTAGQLAGRPWSVLQGKDCSDDSRQLCDAITQSDDFVGTFRIERGDLPAGIVDAYSNLIEDEHGHAAFRLAVLVEAPAHDADRAELEQRLRERDMQLKELQHRVRNNLQMITALIRMEARNVRGSAAEAGFNRLAGRIESLKLLYDALAGDVRSEHVDLGIYLSQIAAAALRAYANEGISLDLKVDAHPVSLNVAMSVGLVVNELLTNALKHAFVERDGGTITLHSLRDPEGWCILVADDGVGMPAGEEWPRPGKLSALIVESLRSNANARIEIESSPGEGMKVKIIFSRAAAA